jgi:hypothetical protein
MLFSRCILQKTWNSVISTCNCNYKYLKSMKFVLLCKWTCFFPYHIVYQLYHSTALDITPPRGFCEHFPGNISVFYIRYSLLQYVGANYYKWWGLHCIATIRIMKALFDKYTIGLKYAYNRHWLKKTKMSLDSFLGIRPPPPRKLQQLKNRGIHKCNMIKKKEYTSINHTFQSSWKSTYK